MSQVNNFLVIADVPGTDEKHAPDALKPPWVRLDQHVIGDGKSMESRVWARVTNAMPDTNAIAAELRAVPWDNPDAVMLLAKEQEDPTWHVVEWRAVCPMCGLLRAPPPDRAYGVAELCFGHDD